ncbi:MAG TPA: hypothetical protein VFZ79_12480, partial [Acidimicrobiales bacterium]
EGVFSINGWDSDLTFPLGSYIAIFGLVMAVQIALTRFANVDMPDRVLGFTWPQIHLVLAVFAGLLAIGWLIISEDAKFGFWLTFLGAIGLVVGAFMLHSESKTTATTGPGAPPPPPGGSSF